MNRAICAAVALLGCGAVPSTFDFTLSGDVTGHFVSGPDVAGEIDNAGQLALDDGTWAVSMSIGGLAVGDHAVSKGNGELSLVHKLTGEVFTSAIDGTCTVHVDPHASTNGDRVHALFYCTGLASSGGKHVDVGLGEIDTAINDAANDPNLNPPYP